MESVPGKLLLICEGADDKAVLSALCNIGQYDRIDIKECGGIGKLGNAIEAALRENRDGELLRLAVVCDADASFNSRQDSIKGLFNKYRLPFSGKPAVLSEKKTVNAGMKQYNLDTAYYIFPDNNSGGNLESLLFTTLDEKKKGCIEGFLNCAEYEDSVQVHKAKIAAFIAISVKGLYKTLHLALHEDIFDFGHESFTGIKKFLRMINEV